MSAEEACNCQNPARLAELAKHEDPRVRAEVAKNARSPDACLVLLSRDFPEEVAKNDRWVELVRGSDSFARAAQRARARKTTDEDEMARLAGSADAETRALVARNEGTSNEVLSLLLRDQDDLVSVIVAGREDLDAALVDEASTHDSTRVRAVAAAHARLSAKSAERLCKDETAFVRCRLAQNEACPEDVLGLLAVDMDASVRGAVAENPATPAATLDVLYGEERLHYVLGRHPNLSAAACSAIAESRTPFLREMAARHPNTPIDVLGALLEDADMGISTAAEESLMARTS
jgi:hypothetical protein